MGKCSYYMSDSKMSNGYILLCENQIWSRKKNFNLESRCNVHSFLKLDSWMYDKNDKLAIITNVVIYVKHSPYLFEIFNTKISELWTRYVNFIAEKISSACKTQNPKLHVYSWWYIKCIPRNCKYIIYV